MWNLRIPRDVCPATLVQELVRHPSDLVGDELGVLGIQPDGIESDLSSERVRASLHLLDQPFVYLQQVSLRVEQAMVWTVQVRHCVDGAIFCRQLANMAYERIERFVDRIFADPYPQGTVLSRFLGPIGCPAFEMSVSALGVGPNFRVAHLERSLGLARTRLSAWAHLLTVRL